MRTFFYFLLLALSVGAAARADAGSLETLDDFLRQCTSGRADFTQTLTLPARDQQSARVKTSSGQFSFARPHRLRLHYDKPFEQTLVADGNILWMYDPGLQQATGRRVKDALSGTPLALVATALNLRALQAEFQLRADPDQDGLQWVVARPLSADNPLQSLRIGFSGSQLAALDVLDQLGQRSLIRFQNFQANPKLAAAEFEFHPPAGVDVIRP